MLHRPHRQSDAVLHASGQEKIGDTETNEEYSEALNSNDAEMTRL
jgi:hypothetical protein